MKKHSGQTTCPLCQKTFARVPHMRAHMVEKHRLAKQEVDRITHKRGYTAAR